MDPFVDYYAKQSVSSASVEHFIRLRDLLLRTVKPRSDENRVCVADIGCGAGTFSRLWAAADCCVSGLDVNEELVNLANARAAAEGAEIEFRTGSAESLPWRDASFDIVVMPELLEHVPGWHQCLSEAARVLRPGGVLYVSTTNRLCPIQQEFTLPLYSWYPGWLKRRCERKSLSTHRHWVNHAIYPAVNWFDPYTLGNTFRRLGLSPEDRFTLWKSYGSGNKRLLGRVLTAIPPLRWLGHCASSGTVLLGRKL